MSKLKKKYIGIMQLKTIFKGLMPSKRIWFLALIILLVENGLAVGLPYVIMKFVDKMNLKNLNASIILGIIAILVFQLGVAAISAYILIYIAEYVVSGLRKKIINKVLYLPVSFYDENQTGDIMSRIYNDTMIVKDFITKDANYFISDMIILIGSIALMFVIDIKIGLIVSVMIPVTSIIIFSVADREYDVSISLQAETAGFQSLLNRIISDIRLVKSYIAEKIEYNNCCTIIDKLYGLSLKEGRIMAIIRPFSNCIMLILFVTVFGYGSLRVEQGTLTAGGLIAIIMYLFQMSSPASGIASFYAAYKKFTGALKRLQEISQYTGEQKNTEINENEKKELVIENVYFGYNPTKEVLKNISFQIRRGETVAIIGKSGVGKTTIFSLIERFYNPDSGRILYGGVDISNYNVSAWRRKIAYVSQDSPIMYGTILSNLTYGLESYTEKQVEWAIEEAKLSDYIKTLPEGYNTLVGERGVKLSGGQRQRLAIARALIRNPEILLLDEATSHLDSDSEKLVQESLDALMKGRTTLVIAHNLSTVRNVDRLMVVQEGKITGIGSHKELLENNDLYRKFIEQQSCEGEEKFL